MEESIRNLKQQIKYYKLISVFSFILALCVGSYLFVSESRDSKLITTRGIIIQDDSGNDRILIGTPIPVSPDRVRTDSTRAWETYVNRWPEKSREQIWNWYKDYNHSTNGILFLSESGFDRISIGDPTPDPNIGKRIAPGTGFVLMDEEGYERSGYSIMNFDGKYKIVLGLDSKKGTEGLALMVDDYGYNGMVIPGNGKTTFIGNADTTFWATSPYEKFNGLIIRTRDSLLVDIQ